MNINSENVKIYPVGNRTNNLNGPISQYGFLEKLNIEQNIIKQRNSIVDNKSYLVTSTVTLSNSTLIVSTGSLVINGYTFTLKNPINISLNSYIDTNGISYWVYFSIQLENKPISYEYDDNITYTLNQNQLKGEDIPSTNTYTGIEFNLNRNYPLSSNTDLVLGVVHYDGDTGWSLFENTNDSLKVSFNDMSINVPIVSGLSNDDTDIVNNWLENNFIIDDGEI